MPSSPSSLADLIDSIGPSADRSATLDSLERFAAQRARILALDSISHALNSLIAVMDAHPGTDKALRAASRIITLAFSPAPRGGDGRRGGDQRGCDQRVAPTRDASSCDTMPKASTEVATGCPRGSGSPWESGAIEDPVRPSSLPTPAGGTALREGPGACEPHATDSTGVSQTQPPAATPVQPFGLSDPAPQDSSLTAQVCSPPSAPPAVSPSDSDPSVAACSVSSEFSPVSSRPNTRESSPCLCASVVNPSDSSACSAVNSDSRISSARFADSEPDQCSVLQTHPAETDPSPIAAPADAWSPVPGPCTSVPSEFSPVSSRPNTHESSPCLCASVVNPSAASASSAVSPAPGRLRGIDLKRALKAARAKARAPT